jgi:hypothetical protein
VPLSYTFLISPSGASIESFLLLPQPPTICSLFLDCSRQTNSEAQFTMRLLAVLVAVLPLVTCLDTRMKHVSHSEPTSTPTSDLLFPTETNVCPGGPKSCNDDYQACKKFYRGRYVEFCRNLICGPVWVSGLLGGVQVFGCES